MLIRACLCALIAAAGILPAQEKAAWRKEGTAATAPATISDDAKYTITTGTKIPLSLINSVSTKHSAQGDRVYLQTVFPIMDKGRVIIPPGSYVAGTVTQIKRPGRVKGRGELYVRFDSLTLPNGVTRDFRARLGSVDSRGGEELDRTEGKVRSEADKAGDARTIGEGTAAGASIGVIAGSAAGHLGMGAGIGAAAGAAGGLMGVLLSRGPDAVLAKGSTIEMVLDRNISFDSSELNFGPMQPANFSDGGGPIPSKKDSGLPSRRFPF